MLFYFLLILFLFFSFLFVYSYFLFLTCDWAYFLAQYYEPNLNSTKVWIKTFLSQTLAWFWPKIKGPRIKLASLCMASPAFQHQLLRTTSSRCPMHAQKLPHLAYSSLSLLCISLLLPGLMPCFSSLLPYTHVRLLFLMFYWHFQSQNWLCFRCITSCFSYFLCPRKLVYLEAQWARPVKESWVVLQSCQ